MRRREWFRRVIGGVAPVSIAAALSACARGGSAPAAATSASAAPAMVRWPGDANDPTKNFAEQVNKRIADKYGPKITAVWEPFPDSDQQKRYEKYTAMAIAGTAPEVIWLNSQFLRPFFSTGLALELDPYIKRDWKAAQVDDFFKGMWDGMKLGGKQMAIPVFANNTQMYVNKNYLREAGLPAPPESWNRQQFLDYATKLNRPGNDHWGYQMSFAGINRIISFIWSNGGEVHDQKDGPVVTKLTYDDPKTIEALEFLHDMVWKQQVSPATDAQRGGVALDNAFVQGKAGLHYSGSNVAGDFITQAQTTGLDWDFAPLVKGPGGYGSRIGNDGYMVNKTTKVPDQAWTVVRELSTTEVQVIRVKFLGRQPPIKSATYAWEQLFAGKTPKLVTAMAESARPDPQAFWKDSDQVSTLITSQLRATMERNEITVKDAMAKAMADVRAYYATAK